MQGDRHGRRSVSTVAIFKDDNVHLRCLPVMLPLHMYKRFTMHNIHQRHIFIRHRIRLFCSCFLMHVCTMFIIQNSCNEHSRIKCFFVIFFCGKASAQIYQLALSRWKPDKFYEVFIRHFSSLIFIAELLSLSVVEKICVAWC